MLLVQLVDFHFKQHIYGERERGAEGRDREEEKAVEDSGERTEVKVTGGQEREARGEGGGEKKNRGCVRRGEVSQEGESGGR